MDKRIKKIVLIGIILTIIIAGFVGCCKSLKIDEFTPAAVIFVVDSSASNQAKLDEQKQFVKQVCNRLDPEDKIKSIRVSEEAYLIFEGSPHNSKNITDSMNEFTKYDSKDWGTAYGQGIDKALIYATSMHKEGYKPAIIVVGDLENEGALDKQLDWNKLPIAITNFQKLAPEFAMMFAYAHPQKLDTVKTKLAPVLGETKLVISTEQNIDKSINKFLDTIER